HPWHRDEIRVERHEPRKERRHALAVEILVEVMTGGGILVEAAAAEAECLGLCGLLPRSRPRLWGPGLHDEAEAPESGHGADDFQEIAAADADRGKTLLEQTQLLIRNTHQSILL